MDNNSNSSFGMSSSVAGKENARGNPTRPYTTAKKLGETQQRQQQQQQQTSVAVPKTPKPRVDGTIGAAASTRVRRSGLSLREDGNGGAPSSSLRARAATAATALCSSSSKSKGEEEMIDTSNSSSDFTGPQRVRVGNSNTAASSISLSFWSLPASTPDSNTSRSRLGSQTMSRARPGQRQQRTGATAAAGAGAASTPSHNNHHRPSGAASREPLTIVRAGGGSSSSSSSSRKSTIHESADSAPAVDKLKRARTNAEPATTRTTAVTGMMAASDARLEESRQKWSRSNGGGSRIPDEIFTEDGASDSSGAATASSTEPPLPTAAAAAAAVVGPSKSPAAATSSAANPRSSPCPFGTDISHILSWKPAPRPNATPTSSAAAAASFNRVVSTGEEEDARGGSGSAAALSRQEHQRHQPQEQRSSSSSSSISGNAAAMKSNQKPLAAMDASVGASSASSAVSSGDDPPRSQRAGFVTGEEPKVGAAAAAAAAAAARTGKRAAPTRSATAPTATRPRISASLEALRVRVVKKADGDDDDDDDDDDSFDDVDLKLEAYDAEMRRRSADAAAAPRAAALGAAARRTPVTPVTAGAAAALPSSSRLGAPTAAAAGGTIAMSGAGAPSKGGVSGGVGSASSSSSPSAREGFAKKAPVAAAEEVGVPSTAYQLRKNSSSSSGSSGSGNKGENGSSEARWDGGGRPLWSGAGVSSGRSGGGGGGGGRGGAAPGSMSRVAEEDEDMSLTIGAGSGALFPNPIAAGAVADGYRGSSSSFNVPTVSRATNGAAAASQGSGAAAAAQSGEGGREERGADLSPPLGSEKTDTSDHGSCVSCGGGGDGVGVGVGRGEVTANSSGLLGGGSSTGGSVRDSGPAEKPTKAVAFAHAPSSNWSEIMVNGVRYQKTAQIGRGGSSKVFRVVAPDCEMMALKVVKVDDRVEDAGALLDSYSNEIELLKRLKGNPFIINLENSEVDRSRGLISIVLELGETDLDKLLRQYKTKIASSRVDPATLGLFPGGLDANFVRVIWQQMLKAVEAMHDNRVVHGDLKPANFVFVKGALKLIDFGIAKAIANDTTNISRDARVGTWNYMCPEAFEDTGKGDVDPTTGRQTTVIKQGRASDIWSLGCILYQMTHGKTPFAHLGMLPKIRAITNPKHTIAMADLEDIFLADTLRSCLERDPLKRAKIGGEDGLLAHSYLHPVAARAALARELEAKVEKANALAARSNERAVETEQALLQAFDANVKERVARAERELSLRFEGKVRAALSRAEAESSISKSLLKHIIASTVRILHAEGKANIDPATAAADIDRITALVVDIGRTGGGGGGLGTAPRTAGARH